MAKDRESAVVAVSFQAVAAQRAQFLASLDLDSGSDGSRSRSRSRSR